MLSIVKDVLTRLYAFLGGDIYYINSGEALPPPLSREEEAKIMEQLRAGDEEVKQTLIERNLRLVVYIARKFENTGVCVEDLISIGTIGLIKAVNTFDAEKRIKLATYASRCIENEILMYLRRSCKLKLEVSLDEPLNVDGTTYHITAVSMGNPHAIVYMDDLKDLDIEKIGPKFENHIAFPDRINTEFVKVIDRHTLQMRVWERGSGETLACGTGACAVAVASTLNGLVDEDQPVTVKLLGGDLQILWNRQENLVYMTGPATTVFDGEIFL